MSGPPGVPGGGTGDSAVGESPGVAGRPCCVSCQCSPGMEFAGIGIFLSPFGAIPSFLGYRGPTRQSSAVRFAVHMDRRVERGNKGA